MIIFRNDRDIIRVLKANQDNGTGSVPVASELENYLICGNKYVNASFISSACCYYYYKNEDINVWCVWETKVNTQNYLIW